MRDGFWSQPALRGLERPVVVDTDCCWRRFVSSAVSVFGVCFVMIERIARRSSGRPVPVRAEVSMVG